MRCLGLLFLIFFSITSCKTEEKSRREETIPQKDSTDNSPVMASTEMQIMTFSNYEDPFREDTLSMELPIHKFKIPERDSMFTVKYLFSASYPQSKLKEHQKFNLLVEEKVENYFKEHLLQDENDIYCFYVNAEFKATDFEWNDDYMEVLFMEQDYFQGAAHYNHGYHSFHFDLKKSKEIKLTDLLIFKNGEAQKFADAFNPDPTSTSNEIILTGEDFTDDRPFFTGYGELYLYFSDGEKSPSMERVIIPYSKFKGYVNPEYKYLFED